MRVRYRGNPRRCDVKSMELIPENWEETRLLSQLIVDWRIINSATFYPVSGHQIQLFAVHFGRKPEKITRQRCTKRNGKPARSAQCRRLIRPIKAKAVPREPGRVSAPNLKDILKAPRRGGKN